MSTRIRNAEGAWEAFRTGQYDLDHYRYHAGRGDERDHPGS